MIRKIPHQFIVLEEAALSSREELRQSDACGEKMVVAVGLFSCGPLNCGSGRACVHFSVHNDWSTAVLQLMDTRTSSLSSYKKHTKRLNSVSYDIRLMWCRETERKWERTTDRETDLIGCRCFFLSFLCHVWKHTSIHLNRKASAWDFPRDQSSQWDGANVTEIFSFFLVFA